MKILLIGEYRYNGGPSNVNKKIIENLNGDIMYIKSTSKFKKLLELIVKIFKSDVVVFSGNSSHTSILCKFSKILNKKNVYIMHGYFKYEVELNNLQGYEKEIRSEEKTLKNVDKILCVSEKYMNFIKTKLPNYSYKIDFFNNGVEIKKGYNHIPTTNNSFKIALFGGSRPSKNNEPVCLAVQKLIEENFDIEINVFGRNFANDEGFLRKYKFVNYLGHIEQKQLYKELEKIDIFILNSSLESFGLTVFDALSCGCSILLSQYCGCLSVLKTDENDVIFDPKNVDEIANKIKFLLTYPNNKKILDSLDLERTSWKSTSRKLMKICNQIKDDEK